MLDDLRTDRLDVTDVARDETASAAEASHCVTSGDVHAEVSDSAVVVCP